MKTKYLNAKQIRLLAKEHNKRTGGDFLMQLDQHIHKIVVAACAVHNGGKQTLDRTVAAHVGAN